MLFPARQNTSNPGICSYGFTKCWIKNDCLIQTPSEILLKQSSFIVLSFNDVHLRRCYGRCFRCSNFPRLRTSRKMSFCSKKTPLKKMMTNCCFCLVQNRCRCSKNFWKEWNTCCCFWMMKTMNCFSKELSTYCCFCSKNFFRRCCRCFLRATCLNCCFCCCKFSN